MYRSRIARNRDMNRYVIANQGDSLPFTGG